MLSYCCFGGSTLLSHCLAPVASILAERFSPRTVTFCGAAIACAGMSLSSQAKTLTHLYFSYGMLMGKLAKTCIYVTLLAYSFFLIVPCSEFKSRVTKALGTVFKLRTTEWFNLSLAFQSNKT